MQNRNGIHLPYLEWKITNLNSKHKFTSKKESFPNENHMFNRQFSDLKRQDTEDNKKTIYNYSKFNNGNLFKEDQKKFSTTSINDLNGNKSRDNAFQKNKANYTLRDSFTIVKNIRQSDV